MGASFYNLYFTNARVDSRITTTNASVLADVAYSTPANGDVLMWNSSTNLWEAIQPPGASGGETNTVSNVGGGQGLFSNKLGAELRFFTLAASNGVTISAPSSNVITISNSQDLITTASPTFGNLTKLLEPKGNQTVLMNGTNAFIYFAYPATYGSLISIKDQNQFEYLNNAIPSFTPYTRAQSGSYGWSTNYIIYKYTANLPNGTNANQNFTFAFTT